MKRRGARVREALLALPLFLALPAGAAAEGLPPASASFARASAPSMLPPRAIGSYSNGCVTGAVSLAADGAHWQAMRPSRQRTYGHPALVGFIEDLAAQAPEVGLRGLLVGDLGQPRGGPLPTGHRSHQIGLDADIWLQEMPAEPMPPAERETRPFVSVLDASGVAVDPERFTPAFAALLEFAARDGRVARIFVHPAIKRALCAASDAPRPWLSRIRPWYGHDSHMHVRLACPEDSPGCQGQAPPPAGDGCGAQLAWWFTDAPYRREGDAAPPAPLTLDRMPKVCRALVASPSR